MFQITNKACRIFFLFILVITSAYVNAQDTYVNSARLIEKGIKNYDEGEYQEAIKKYLQINRSDTNYLYSLTELAITYIADSQFTKAVEVADIGLKQKSIHQAHLYRSKGTALDYLNKTDESIEVYKQALKKFPYDYVTTFNLGVTYEKKDKNISLQYYQRAIKINPYHANSYYRSGLIYEEQGKLVPAMLSYYMYLLMKPSGSKSMNLLNKMEEISRNEIELPEVKGNNPYADLETMIKAKVAMSTKYKLKVKLDDPLVRQTQLIMEKLVYSKEDTSFIMQHDVKFLTDIMKAGYFEEFVYLLFSGVNNDKIQSWLEKNKKSKEAFVKWAGDDLLNMVNTRKENILGEEKIYNTNYFSSNSVSGIGNYKDATKAVKVGPWKFFYENGEVSAIGRFDDNGKKIGEWKYYHANGNLKEVETYVNGVSQGKFVSYHENGAKQYECELKDGKVNGLLKIYNKAGLPESEKTFKDGVLEGPAKAFFISGKPEIELGFKSDKRDGQLKAYNKAGILIKDMAYVNGMMTGPYKYYYSNGKLQTEGTFKDDKEIGEWKDYFENGKLKQTLTYMEGGIPKGEYKTFHDNGQVSEKGTYNEKGKLDGLYTVYDEDGVIHFTIDYVNGKVKGLKYYDKKGTVVADFKEKSGVIDIKGYFPDGKTLQSEGKYKDGEKDGPWKYYTKNGVVSSEENFVNGKRNGQYKAYYDNGTLKEEYLYKYDELEGAYKEYYKNKVVKTEGYFLKDKREGAWKEYYPTGKLSEMSWYNNGEQDGYYEDFYITGIKKREVLVQDGMFTAETYFDTTGKEISFCNLDHGNGDYKQTYVNGKVRCEGVRKAGDLIGMHKNYYPQGTLWDEMNYVEGKRHGEYKSYNEKGILVTNGKYFLGEREGVWKYYFDDGKTIRSTGKYHHDGYDSLWTWYNESGVRNTEGYFKNHLNHGVYIHYSPDGKDVALIRTFVYDIAQSYTYHDKNGNKVPEIPIVNETADIVGYYSNGTKSIEFKTVKGYREGKTIAYYQTGSKWYEKNFEQGEMTGEYTEYFANGKLKEKSNYFYDEKHGKCVYYYENGNIKSEENYVLGSKHGVFKYYDQNGKLIKEQNYFDNTLIQ